MKNPNARLIRRKKMNETNADFNETLTGIIFVAKCLTSSL